jgi:outer membrane receptor for ferrienterochelin and colicins
VTRQAYASLAAALLSSGFVAAQEPTTAAASAPYQSVVTASRTETRLADVPIATEVISRREIERSGARDVGDVLALHPGMQLTRSFAGVEVMLQGLDSQYVLILIDGQRVIGRVNGAIDLSRIPTDDIERIEIVRGPSSALYGADAIGGVVNIITRRARRRYEADGSVSYGTLDTSDVRASGGIKRESFSAHVAGGFHHRDAYRLDATTPATSGSAYDEFELGTRTEYRTPRRFRISAGADYLQRRLSGVDASAPGAVFDRQNVTETLWAQVTPDITFDVPARLRITGSYSLYRDQYLSKQRGSDALDQYQQTREQLGGVGIQYDHVLSAGHLLSFGLEGQVELLDSDRLANRHGNRWRGAFFAQDQWNVVDAPRFVVVPAIRVDVDSQFGRAFSPKLAVRFDPHPRVVLRGSYGRGFRAPTFKELLLHFENPGVGYVVDGNLSLQPETSDGFDVGAEARAASWFWMSLNLFRNDLKSLIAPSLVDAGGAGSPQHYQYINISAAYTQGIETSVRVGPIHDLVFELGYTLTDSKDEKKKRPLPGRSLHAGTFLVGFSRARWGLEATLRGAVFGSRHSYADNADGTYQTLTGDPYIVVDARVAESIKQHVTLFIGAQNLVNAGDARFTPLAPRTFYGGVAGRY